MKNIIIILAIVVIASCTKSKMPPSTYAVQNTSWSDAKNPGNHYSFTASQMTVTYTGIPVYSRTLDYISHHDTILVYQLMFSYKFTISHDSLLLADIRTDYVLHLYHN